MIACLSVVYAPAFLIYLTGLLGARLAEYAAVHELGLSYALYYVTFALDSVGDVFGSVALLGAGLLILETGALPRRLGQAAVVAAPFLFVQGFGLGGGIGTFRLVIDGIGFVLFLAFVLLSSVALLRRPAIPS